MTSSAAVAAAAAVGAVGAAAAAAALVVVSPPADTNTIAVCRVGTRRQNGVMYLVQVAINTNQPFAPRSRPPSVVCDSRLLLLVPLLLLLFFAFTSAAATALASTAAAAAAAGAAGGGAVLSRSLSILGFVAATLKELWSPDAAGGDYRDEMAVATYAVHVASRVARELQEELCKQNAIR